MKYNDSLLKIATRCTLGWLAFMDVALALFPITIIQKLSIARRTKIGLCLLLGLEVLYVAMID